MTALELQDIGLRPTASRRLRRLLARMTLAIDALVSARAARAVPDWQMKVVQSEITRHLSHIKAAKRRRGGRQRSSMTFDQRCRAESAICNFGR